MQELYRSNFNAANAFKMATVPNWIARQIGAKLWWKQAFLGFVSLCGTNAYLAYNCVTGGKMDWLRFRERLAW